MKRDALGTIAYDAEWVVPEILCKHAVEVFVYQTACKDITCWQILGDEVQRIEAPDSVFVGRQ